MAPSRLCCAGCRRVRRWRRMPSMRRSPVALRLRCTPTPRLLASTICFVLGRIAIAIASRTEAPHVRQDGRAAAVAMSPLVDPAPPTSYFLEPSLICPPIYTRHTFPRQKVASPGRSWLSLPSSRCMGRYILFYGLALARDRPQAPQSDGNKRPHLLPRWNFPGHSDHRPRHSSSPSDSKQ